MKVSLGWRIAIVGLLCAGISVVLLIALSGRSSLSNAPAKLRLADVAWTPLLADVGKSGEALEITYPADETVFPPEIVEPKLRWREKHSEADAWLVKIDFADGKEPIQALIETPEWTPSPEQWRDVKARSVASPAKVTVLGVNQESPNRLLSAATIRISTSRDEVGAPVFYRDVPLPFAETVNYFKRIRWRFGPISSRTQPPVVLEDMPVCANCHSFSADGKQFAMDVDYANDKASYVMSPVEEEMVLDPGKLITWADYKKEDKQLTFGLLSQVSPDGRYAISTVKDRSVFVQIDNLEISQLFFPVKGLLAVYDRETKTFSSLPGADDPQYVQSNPAWSPDGKYVVFARSRAYQLQNLTNEGRVVLTAQECEEFVKGGKKFLFDLYRVPFNDGKGGQAEPLPGASENGMSNYFAKYSPDGKWIVFCKAKSFMLLQPDSELYIMPADGGEPRRLRGNTRRMNSWHTWSPNSRWLAFVSKVNGPFTQLFLTHIDEQGESTPPVELANFTATDRAVNIPEFVNVSPNAVLKMREQFMDEGMHMRAGDVSFNGGEFKDAEQMYREALKMSPRNPEAHTHLAMTLIHMRQTAEALQHLNKAVELDRKNADLHYLRVGGAFLDTKDLKNAEQVYRKAVESNPRNPDAHMRLATTLLAVRQPDEALKHLNAAVELDPKSADLHFLLGNILGSLRRVPEALAHFEQAVQLNPKHAEAQNGLGTALASAGKLQEAILHYKLAVEAKPDFAKARSNLSQALADAVGLNPNSAKLLGEWGDALMNAGRGAEAIEPLQRAVQLNPQDASAHNSLAWLLATMDPAHGGNPVKAVALAQRACQLTENNSAGCLDTLAVACAAAGQFPEAIAAAEKAIQLATAAGQDGRAKRIEGRLEFYRAGRAYDGSVPRVKQPAA